MHLQRPEWHDARVAPAAALLVVHAEHMVGEIIPEACAKFARDRLPGRGARDRDVRFWLGNVEHRRSRLGTSSGRREAIQAGEARWPRQSPASTSEKVRMQTARPPFLKGTATGSVHGLSTSEI